MTSPCKDCENRSPICHTTCTPYLEARAVQIRQNTCGWGERMTDDYKSKIIQQTKKKYERRRWR